jgi:Ca2+-binding RTX toxin-like protein
MATTSVPSSEAGQTWTFVHPDDVQVSQAPGGPLAISLRYDQSDLLNNPHGMVAIEVREPAGNGTTGVGGGLRTPLRIDITNGLGIDTVEGGAAWTGFDIMLAYTGAPLDQQVFHPGYAHFHNATAANFPGLVVTTTTPTFGGAGDGSAGPPPAIPSNIHLEGAIPFGSFRSWGTAGEPDLVLHQRTFADHDDSFVITLWPQLAPAELAKLLPTEGPDRLFGGTEGDFITALGGDDVVDGRGGNDTLQGAAGDDLLLGGPGRDDLRGGEGDDTLEGGPGDFEVLSGGNGADAADYSAQTEPVIADLGAGFARFIDTSFFPFDQQPVVFDTLYEIEDVWTGSHNDTLAGSAVANRLVAGAGNDLLRGGEGDDTLDGGPGADRMEGGPGTDTYHVDDPGDVVVELQASGFPDTVVSTVSFALPDFLDDLRLGGTGGIDGTGNDAANRITANLGNNVLAGRGGADEFRFFSATGSDRVADFAPGEDRIAILAPGIGGMGDLTIGEQGGSAVLSWSIDGIASQVTLSGVSAAALSANDFVFG